MARRKLHIGGKEKKEGWEIFNIFPGKDVDHVGNANDLSRFEDNSFSNIYASHILEHFDYNKEIVNALSEWFRVLSPRGKLYVAVPDLDALAAALLDKEHTTLEERFLTMRRIFGGHMDEHDHHKVGLNMEFLSALLNQVGFINIHRVKDFNLFNDTSTLDISLNVIAEKP